MKRDPRRRGDGGVGEGGAGGEREVPTTAGYDGAGYDIYVDVVRACESSGEGLTRRRRRGLLPSAPAFRPIECTLYRLVDAYLLAEAFSHV